MTQTRRIIITGASGFIGRPAARALQKEGFEVHALDLSNPNIDGVTFSEANLLSADDALPHLLRIKASHLLHLAWTVSPGKFWTDSANLDWVAASLKLCRAFVDAGGQRIVATGTCAEYDWTHERLTERSTPLVPSTLYGAAKLSFGALLEAYGGQSGVSTAWGRLFFLYGPREARGRLVSDIAAALLSGERVATTEGRQVRDFMHVNDAADAIAKLAASECQGPVNIASGESASIRDIIEMIAGFAGAPSLVDFGARAMTPGDPMKMTADITRLREELGFHPRFTLREGLADAVAWRRNESSAND